MQRCTLKEARRFAWVDAVDAVDAVKIRRFGGDRRISDWLEGRAAGVLFALGVEDGVRVVQEIQAVVAWSRVLGITPVEAQP